MENNKYYTPDISEFHVGFQYEERGLYIDGKRNWYDREFDLHHCLWSSGEPGHVNLLGLISSKRVIVKYLSKEDIESLGFEQSENDTWIGWHDYYYSKLISGNIPYFLHASLHTPRMGDDYQIILHRGNPRDINIEDQIKEYESEVVFKGRIKNISELKRLLKQLGIDV